MRNAGCALEVLAVNYYRRAQLEFAHARFGTGSMAMYGGYEA